LRKRFLPTYDARTQGADLNLLQFGWQQWRSGRAMDAKAPIARVEGLPPRPREGYAVVPPMYPFLEHARGVATANAEPDAVDGVLRRPWSHLRFQGKSYPYLGLQAGAQALAGPGGGADTVVYPDHVDVVAHPVQGGERRMTIPTDADGRILVDWAGNGRRNRSASESSFTHIPFVRFAAFFTARYDDLDKNVRQHMAQANEEERQVLQVEEYLKLSDRFNEALAGRGTMSFEKARAAEEKLDGIRKNMIETYRQVAAGIDKSLKTITSPRARQGAEKERDNRLKIAQEIAAAYEEEARLRPLIEGKLCLIGSASTGSGDLQATPLGSSVPGMDVLANVANMVLTGQGIRRAPAWVNFVYLFAVGLLVSYYVTHSSATISAVATAGTVAATGGLFWGLFTGPSLLISGAGPAVTAILTFAGVTAYKELLTQRSKRKLQRELEKNTSPELVKIILERPEVLSEPRRIMGTFFFSDVKSFTSISEKMHADVLFPFINRYLDRQTQALKRHQAFVDKYIGDGIMALFGIPVPTPDHARNACLAALDCQAALKPLNAEFKLEGLPQIKARIGIHSGEVSAGNVGALDRSNYTVLGDNVNLAARLEGANKEYDTSIMISEATWALVQGRFVVRELDRIRVVGKKNAVKIYELIAPAGAELPMAPAFLDAYAGALAAFKDRRWEEAIREFQRALELRPGDTPSETYVERARGFRVTPPPADWEGVFDLTSK
jgi:class 3 adenylate cyclase